MREQKRIVAVIVLAAAVSGGIAMAQQSDRNAQPDARLRVDNQSQAERERQQKLAAQRRYDPLAGQEHLKGGAIEHALDAVNPHDIDYGAKLASTRRELIDSTVRDSRSWLLFLFGSGLMLAIAYIVWLHHERYRRFDVSVGIVAQLTNAYLHAKRYALDAVAQHNQLTDEYNSLAEATARYRNQEQAVEAQVRAEAAVIANNPQADAGPDALRVAAVEAQAANSAAATGNSQQIALSFEPGQNLQFSQRQVDALKQQNRNLRDQLSEALQRIQELERVVVVKAGG